MIFLCIFYSILTFLHFLFYYYLNLLDHHDIYLLFTIKEQIYFELILHVIKQYVLILLLVIWQKNIINYK